VEFRVSFWFRWFRSFPILVPVVPVVPLRLFRSGCSAPVVPVVSFRLFRVLVHAFRDESRKPGMKMLVGKTRYLSYFTNLPRDWYAHRDTKFRAI
jgi:hypothetical protein